VPEGRTTYIIFKVCLRVYFRFCPIKWKIFENKYFNGGPINILQRVVFSGH